MAERSARSSSKYQMLLAGLSSMGSILHIQRGRGPMKGEATCDLPLETSPWGSVLCRSVIIDIMICVPAPLRDMSTVMSLPPSAFSPVPDALDGDADEITYSDAPYAGVQLGNKGAEESLVG